MPRGLKVLAKLTWRNGTSERTRGARHVARSAKFVILLVLLMPVPSAWAQVGDDPSSPDQYREEIPTSKGSTPVGGSGSDGGGGSSDGGSFGSASVASEVEQELARRGGSDAGLLRRLVFSPEYGAPPAARGAQSALGDDDGGGAGAAATSAVSGGGGRIYVMLAVLALALAAIAVAAVRRQRRSQ